MKQSWRGEAMGRVWCGEESAAVVLVGRAAKGTAIGPVPVRQLFQKLSMDLSLCGQSRGCRGAASCRPPRSWHLGRRSGRVPALPYPPPRLLQCIRDQDHLAIRGSVSRSQGERAGSARDRAPGSGGGSRSLTERRIAGAVRGSAYCVVYSAFERIFKIRRMVRDRIAVI